MKDGELVQLATPQEMVLHPANDYVREFVKIAPRDKILTLGAIARPLTGELPQQALAADTKLCDAAAQILASDQRFSVLNQNQQAMGTVTREDLIEALFPQTATL